MRRLLLGLFMAVLVTAKPELYREKEDFQYSRSSSDEGLKSGYYDAQRGNMGGNYERAHNMDTLAQHQMGGLVKQVEGELGDGSNTRTGSVFTAANSQGIYGSGRYDLSHLAGRNFQEGATYHDSQSHSSSASRAHSSQYSAHNNARYNADSQYHNSGFGGLNQYDNLQQVQNYGNRDYEHGSQSQRGSKYYLQSGYQGSSDYERLNTNHQSSNEFGDRYISQVPVRIVVRPGTRVAIPIATQAHTGSQAASYDQSNINSEAEVLNSGDQQTVLRPTGDAKHYESSYSYRKEWEKHHTSPEAVPLATPVLPIPKNSDLYDESRLHQSSRHQQNADYNQASSQISQQANTFNTQHSASSSESRHQADYNSRHQADYNSRHQSTSADLHSNDYTQRGYTGEALHSGNLIGSVTSKPKSYQSSYSYHKSWERQGDPYVIIPPSNGAYDGHASQRLTDLSGSQADYSSHNYGSRKSHHTYSVKDCVIECDPNSHIRVARSYNSDSAQSENEQEVQQSWDQQTQHGLGETHNNWENLGQQTQDSWNNLEDLGQQMQSTWGDLGQQVQNTGQQVQNNWENLEDLGQKTQTTWEQSQNTEQQIQNKFDKLEDLGQQAQTTWDQSQNTEQQVQNKFDKLEDLGQQTQNKWEQQTQDAGQQIQNTWNNLEVLGQHEHSQDAGQSPENTWDLGQQIQSVSDGQKSAGQEIENGWNKLEAFGQKSEKGQDQQTQDNWDTQKTNEEHYSLNINERHDLSQHASTQSTSNEQVPVFHEGTQTNQEKFNLWDKITDLDQTQTFETQISFDQIHKHRPHETSSQIEDSDQTQDLNQQTQDFNQQTQAFDDEQPQTFQHGFDQKFNHFGSHEPSSQTINLDQQTQDFDQQTQDLDQQAQDFDQQTQTLDAEQPQTFQNGFEHIFNHYGSHEPSSQTTDSSQQTQNFDLDQPQPFKYQNGFEQTLNHQISDESLPQTVDLSQQRQAFGREHQNMFEYQNKFEETFKQQDKSQEQAFHIEDYTPQTHDIWNNFEKHSFSSEHRDVSNGNIQAHKPSSTGSLNSLWGKLDELDGDAAPLSITRESSDYSPQPEDFDLTSVPQGSYNWHEQSKFNQENSSQESSNFNTWWLTKDDTNQNQSETAHNAFDISTKTTTEQYSLVSDLPSYSTLRTNEDKTRPVDFGRGDIGPEDSIIDSSMNTDRAFQRDIENHDKQYKDLGTLEDENQDQSNDQTKEKVFNSHSAHTDDSNKYNKSNDKPLTHNVVIDQVPVEEFEQQFVSQNSENLYNCDQTQFQHDHEERLAALGKFGEEGQISQVQKHDDYADQKFEDFNQMNQQFDSDQHLQQQFPDDFYQQSQHPQSQNGFDTGGFDQQQNVQQNKKSEFEILPINEQNEKKVMTEQFIQPPNANNMQENSSNKIPEPVTEKPGFWKSLGSKFTNAKKKVSSWFGS